MTTQEQISAFISKWGPGGASADLNEEQGAQQHFIELCAVLGVATPSGDDYVFEKAGRAPGQRPGYADVFKRDCFAWENKAPGQKLDIALNQMMRYAMALGNPPLFVVSDRLRIEVHTHFNGTPTERHEVLIQQLGDPAMRQLLRRCFEDPESFRPSVTNRQITEEAAKAFAATAKRLRDAGIPDSVTSHLLTQCVFCFFAESVRLLPTKPFWRLLNNLGDEADWLQDALGALFASMRDGTMFGPDKIAWFNGGLFNRIEIPALSRDDLSALRDAAGLDWSAIDPTIFGTLFERGLDPKKNNLIGARFTDPATIMRLIEPVVQRPLLAEWAQAKVSISEHLATRDRLRAEAAAVPSTTPTLLRKFGRIRTAANDEERKAQVVFKNYLERLRTFRVLDPACGSGNFLYLALRALKDIELTANVEAETLGLHREVDGYTGPSNVMGIELNEYAAELARVTVWIGELQWRDQNGMPHKENPVLDSLEHIECRDALLNKDWSEAAWPSAMVVVGNPPFVGDKKMRAELGDSYTDKLRETFKGRVLGGADLVCYWFEKARRQIESGQLQRAGLVATNSIRQNSNRDVLKNVMATTRIFDAWADEPWINDGAAVRVSLVSFGNSEQPTTLNGHAVQSIFADLNAGSAEGLSIDLTSAQPLSENESASYFGFCLAGPFVVDSASARKWLSEPNPHGRSNAEVLRPVVNGVGISGRPVDRWMVDFGATMDEAEAAQFEMPFEHALRAVKPVRAGNREKSRADKWWRHGRPRPELRRWLVSVSRMIVTSETAKHRFFVWLPVSSAPEHKLVVVPRADDASFGMLSSRFHVLWALRNGSTLEDRPVYTTSACFEPYPFPAGLTPSDTAHQRTESIPPDAAVIPADLPPAMRPHAEAIARAAKRLNDLREHWLNPPEWARREPEVVPLGMDASPYPDRILPKHGFEAQLAQRTLTRLYNERPTWLARAHEALDAAVAVAYGWADYTPQMPDEEILRRLLALNRARSPQEKGAPTMRKTTLASAVTSATSK